MHKRIVENQKLGERYIEVKHSSGLTILLYPMEHYQSAYALFGTRYGSIDRTFKTEKDADFVTVPDGIAHFLEHKLFESEDGDAFTLFAKTGASANAFTSFDRTAYLFSCTDRFDDSLRVLLKFVQNPYFSKETVQKEQGIIGQEIRMYDDEPSWRVLFNCLGGLYHNHPVKVDIAGTIQSIAQIDDELLYRCYRTFYNKNNMALCIAGNFAVDQALKTIDDMIEQDPSLTIERADYQEPLSISQKRVSASLAVSKPLFCIGMKMAPKAGLERLKAEAQMTLFLEELIGPSSALYQELYTKGYINDSLTHEVFAGDGYFSLLISGESKDPDVVYCKICDAMENMHHEGLNPQSFERVKKAIYGKLIRSFNQVEAVANNLLACAFSEVSVFDYLDIMASCTRQDVQKAMTEVSAQNTTLSTVTPVE